jgi:predicted molibdopterin-dependent oxidoreductase YjgC
MCDLGRLGYHWIEGGDRLRRPLMRDATGTLQPASWHDVFARLGERLGTADTGTAASPRFLISAHASNEELFLVRQIAATLDGGQGQAGVAVSWRYSEKPQPAHTRFPVPPVDAPNVNGARDFGFATGDGPGSRPDVSGLRHLVEASRVSALYVFDPGPAGSIGDVSWVVRARESGALPLLIVHGVLMTDLARAADLVLAGTSFAEKQATYTNDQGRLQAATRVLAPPGDAMEDWQIFVRFAAVLGLALEYASAAQVRDEIARALAGTPGYGDMAGISFAPPMPAQSWLRASNPSERWKWDFLFRDLPPVKFSEEALPPALPGTEGRPTEEPEG